MSQATKQHRYGRGKFTAHPNYIKYMNDIVDHSNYAGMPNARSEDGRINWQVSSGKGTSFYKYYKARAEWWIKKADLLKLPGKGNSDHRFSIAARLIHPTGYRPCRLTGEFWNVGYFYANHVFARRIIKHFDGLEAAKMQPIDEIIDLIKDKFDTNALQEFLDSNFPERQKYFKEHGYTKEAFEKSNFVPSSLLSPGFMCNPPDRLDGFHDYCLGSRKKNDPGRHDANMRSYIHDRRTFEWWAEGNWALADALYNKAGPGYCAISKKKLKKISPDHVGPLACGFKQLPFFIPLSPQQNSAKNRRLRLHDVQTLVRYEKDHKTSVASWQVRAHWDKWKNVVDTDDKAIQLSHSLRSLQDFYLRLLYKLKEEGKVRFLATLLNPNYAFCEIEFKNLDPGTLTFDSYEITEKKTPNRESLAARSVRIALDELDMYVSKTVGERKLKRKDFKNNDDLVKKVIQAAEKCVLEPTDNEWLGVVDPSLDPKKRERLIAGLIPSGRAEVCKGDEILKKIMQEAFDKLGEKVSF